MTQLATRQTALVSHAELLDLLADLDDRLAALRRQLSYLKRRFGDVTPTPTPFITEEEQELYEYWDASRLD